MPVTEVKAITEFHQIINQDKVTIFDFWATWCGPCRIISPIFEKLSDQFPSIDFYKVDVDSATEISQEAGVRAMPTFIAYKNGKKLEDLVGASPQGLEKLIRTHVDAV